MINREQYQREGDFHEQRRQYRAEALKGLREREGIPAPDLIDGRWVYRMSDGSLSGMATGKVKLPSADEMDQFWGDGSYSGFQTLSIAKDGEPIQKELEDLSRDVELVARSEGVTFGGAEEPNPHLILSDLSDASVDKLIQDVLKEGE